MTRRLSNFFSDQTRKRRLLALDGGGVRVMFALGVLGELEAQLRRRGNNPNLRICEYFDLIGGASTGSIVAASLALGKEVREVAAEFRDFCPRLYKDKKGLLERLSIMFGDASIDSPALQTGLAVFAMRADRVGAHAWINCPGWQHYYPGVQNSEFAPNHTFKLASLVQASVAAPTDAQTVGVTFDLGGRQGALFFDAALSGNNNPALEMLLMVRDPAFGLQWPLGSDQLSLLSIGMGGDLVPTLKGSKSNTEKCMQAIVEAVSRQQVALLQAISRCDRRWVVDAEKWDQPTAPYIGDAPMLDYRRIDVRLHEHQHTDKRTNECANAFMTTPLNHAQATKLAQVDASDKDSLSLLFELGCAVGKSHFSGNYPRQEFDLSAADERVY